jgi:hypothetical protein
MTSRVLSHNKHLVGHEYGVLIHTSVLYQTLCLKQAAGKFISGQGYIDYLLPHLQI